MWFWVQHWAEPQLSSSEQPAASSPRPAHIDISFSLPHPFQGVSGHLRPLLSPCKPQIQQLPDPILKGDFFSSKDPKRGLFFFFFLPRTINICSLGDSWWERTGFGAMAGNVKAVQGSHRPCLGGWGQCWVLSGSYTSSLAEENGAQRYTSSPSIPGRPSSQLP